MLKELADVIAKPLYIIFKSLWRRPEVPEEWRKTNVTPIFKVKKEDPGNYRPVSLTFTLDVTSKASLSMWRKRRSSGVVSTDSQRELMLNQSGSLL